MRVSPAAAVIMAKDTGRCRVQEAVKHEHMSLSDRDRLRINSACHIPSFDSRLDNVPSESDSTCHCEGSDAHFVA